MADLMSTAETHRGGLLRRGRSVPGRRGLDGAGHRTGQRRPAADRVAVRLVVKEQDVVVPRAATHALYDALPGEQDLVQLPGGPFQIGADVIDAAGDRLLARL